MYLKININIIHAFKLSSVEIWSFPGTITITLSLYSLAKSLVCFVSKMRSVERLAHSSITEDRIYSILYFNKQFKSPGNDEKNTENYFSIITFICILYLESRFLWECYIQLKCQRITEQKLVYAFQVRTCSGKVNGVKIKFKENEQS